MVHPRNILICSSAVLTPQGWDLNIGDEALSEGLEVGIRRLLPKANVRRSINLGGAQVPPRMTGRVPVRPLRGLGRAIRSQDLVLLGGGTLLQDDRGLLRYQLGILAMARAAGTPVGLAAIGVENLSRPAARAQAAAICRAARFVSVRDESSAHLVTELTGRRPIVAADPMFLSAVQQTLPLVSRSDKRRIALNVRADASPALLTALRKVLEREVNSGAELIAVPTDRRPDWDASGLRTLLADLPQTAVRTVPPERGWREVYAEMAACDVCIGMRLHFCIFGALARRPTIILATSAKQRSFAADLDLTAIDGITGAGLDGRLDAIAPRLERLAALQDRAARALDPLIS